MNVKVRQLEALKRLPTVLEKVLMRQRQRQLLANETALEQLRTSIPTELISAAQELVRLFREIDELRALAGRHSASHSIRPLEERAEHVQRFMRRWMRVNGWDFTEDLWENIFVIAEERVGPRWRFQL